VFLFCGAAIGRLSLNGVPAPHWFGDPGY